MSRRPARPRVETSSSNGKRRRRTSSALPPSRRLPASRLSSRAPPQPPPEAQLFLLTELHTPCGFRHQKAGASEDRVKHVARELAGEGVLLAHVITAAQDVAPHVRLRSVPEPGLGLHTLSAQLDRGA